MTRYEVFPYLANANHFLDDFEDTVIKTFAKINTKLVPMLPMRENIDAIVNDSMVACLQPKTGLGGAVLRPDLFAVVIDTDYSPNQAFSEYLEQLIAVETFSATRAQNQMGSPSNLLEDLLHEGISMLFSITYAQENQLALLPLSQKVLELTDSPEIQLVESTLKPHFYDSNYPESIFLDGENNFGLPPRSGQALGLKLIRQSFPNFNLSAVKQLANTKLEEVAREY